MSAPNIEYPFPIRPGRIAYIKVPADLTKEEVRRLEQFIKTLIRKEKSNE